MTMRVRSLATLATWTMRQHVRLILLMGAALLVLACAQASVIFLVKGFLAVFFESESIGVASEAGDIALTAMLPFSLVRYFPAFDGATLPARWVAVGLPAGVLIAGLVKSAGTYVYTRVQQEFSFHAGAALRDALFSRIIEQPYEILAGSSAGSWMSMLVNDVAFVQMRLSEIMTSFLRGGIAIFASLAAMMLIHWPSATLMICLLPVIGWSTGRVGRKIAGFARAVQESMQRIAALLLEIRSRFEFMRVQGGEGRDLKRFDQINDTYFAMIVRSILVRSAFAPALEFLGFVIFAGFILGLHSGVINFGSGTEVGSNAGGEILVQFLVAVAFMVKPLRDVGEQLSRYHETRGALDRCFTLIQTAGAGTTAQGSGSIEPALPEIVEIGRVAFNWRSSGNGFYADNLKLPVGRTIAIVGPSGSGKSTFLKILAGLVDPREWSANVSLDKIVAESALVPQVPFLFSATVMDNVAYGTVGASVDQVCKALDMIEAGDFVRGLPDGLETQFATLAANFSGGQIQRLVIARSLLRDRHLLLLDEATSALDAATEGEILERLIHRVQDTGKCLLAVTHRLQWLDLFDEVWFVENGTIALRGSFEELLKTERFARFCASGENLP